MRASPDSTILECFEALREVPEDVVLHFARALNTILDYGDAPVGAVIALKRAGWNADVIRQGHRDCAIIGWPGPVVMEK